MENRYVREAMVGTLVLVAVLIFILGTMWLSGRSIGSDPIRVQFSNAAGLKEGSPVRVSGVPIGTVEKITFVAVERVFVDLNLPERIEPKADASAMIVAISLVGDYAVDFDPGDAAEPLPDGAVIVGEQETGLANVAASLAIRADTLLGNLQEITNERTADDLHNTLVAMERMLNTISDRLPAPTAEATRTMRALRQLTERLDTTLASPALSSRLDTVSTNLAAMTGQLTATTARLDTLLLSINEGQGTLGRLATDSTLYYNLVGVTASLDSLITVLRRDPGKIQLTVPVKVF